MTSTTLCITQAEWDAMSQELSVIFNVDYIPSISQPFTVYQDKIRVPWNKGKIGLQTGNKGYKFGPTSEAEKQNKRIKSTAKWKDPEYRKKVIDNCSLEYIITDPNGASYNIRNLHQFCKDNNLTSSNMTIVAQGKRPHHKGWRCSYATPNQKSP